MFCEIYNGDCRDIINKHAKQWEHAFDFAFADPPFNIGHGYDEYFDMLDHPDYALFMQQWFHLTKWMLRDGGVLAVNVPDDVVELVLYCAKGMTRIEWVIWHYRFGQCVDTKFINSKTHCLIFRKGDTSHTWNPDSILVESDRRAKYNDSRIMESSRAGMRVPLDVWCIENDGKGWGRNTNGKDRMPNHPNQLPIKYPERLILAYTNPGDTVFDPFGGTGTTAAAALQNNRNVVTTELSKEYCNDIARRCMNINCTSGVVYEVEQF